LLERLAGELPNQITHVDTSVHSRLNELENQYLIEMRTRLDAMASVVDVAAGAATTIGEAKLLIEKMVAELPNLVRHLDTSLHSHLNSVQNEGFGELRTQVQQMSGLLGRAIELASSASASKLLVEKMAVELPNQISHLDTGVGSRLNKMENVELPNVLREIHEMKGMALHAQAARVDRKAWAPRSIERYRPARAKSLDDYLRRAKKDFRVVYGHWHDRLQATQRAFAKTKVGNAAHAGDLYSRMFRDFVEVHGAGRILDVGCGVFGRPYYLRGFPRELISGIEPLPMQDACDFELVRGISEYLPWPDHSFSTVVSATSLDHCMSLERSLAEMVRVLSPDGRILLWIGSISGAPKYEAALPDFHPADQFHLFHFDVGWFEPMLVARFEISDRLEFLHGSFSHVFYALRPLSKSPI
jgi:SAM-dependent methyltransferase